jgi:CubicO group peptidase (beta-lactamase class C family)
MRLNSFLRCFPEIAVSIVLVSGCAGQTGKTLPAESVKAIDAAVTQVLTSTGVPSASVAIVKDDQIVFAKAYGNARLDPQVAAQPEMRYSIGSISKQFTATAILMLQEDGKLSLDDPVSKYVSDLTRGNEVTIRELLSQTSGYQDYWPQDYVPPFMLQPIGAQKILDLWARKALDFDPGTQWQYSNTNYVIAGLIIEKTSGMPLLQFLQKRIFSPLGMQSVLNIDTDRLGDTDATGYLRYGLGPLRVAPKEGKGWLFAMGELAMTAPDLARWDIAIAKQSLLKPEGYAQFEKETLLKNGLSTGYGLGVYAAKIGNRRALYHDGEVSGFTANNTVFPDDHAAVVALVNEDAVSAGDTITQKIVPILFPKPPIDPAKVERDRKILEGLQRGKIDRALLTENANAYFSDQALADLASGLAPQGKLLEFHADRQEERGGMTFRLYTAKFEKKSVDLWIREMPDGKLEQYQVVATQ